MTDEELRKFIAHARRALRSHRLEMRWSPAPGDLQAAIDTILGTLQWLLNDHPHARAEIESVVGEHLRASSG